MSDVGPDSIWELGYDWMRDDINEAVSMKILTPASELRLNPEMEEDFNEGIVFERTMINIKKEKILERAQYTRVILLKLVPCLTL